MKIEFEIYEDQIDLLKKIKEIPDLIKHHLGEKVPSSFPEMDRAYQQILEICENLEIFWKQWVLHNLINNTALFSFMKNIKICASQSCIYDCDE